LLLYPAIVCGHPAFLVVIDDHPVQHLLSFASMFALENTPVDIPEFEVYFGFHSATEE
jgi:hypothetical protein